MNFRRLLEKLNIDWTKDRAAMVGLGLLYLLFALTTLHSISGELFKQGFITLFGIELDIGQSYDDGHDRVSMWMTFGAILLAAVGIFYRRMTVRLRRVYFGALLVFVCGALLLVFMKPGITKNYYADTGDAFNYFVVPKYFEELGYTQSYNCAMTAQMERGQKLPKKMRDLTTNQMVKVKERVTPEVQEQCRRRFGQRWAQYVEDIDTYRRWFSQRRWDHWFIDHGYNGTPVRSFFAGLGANAVSLSIENLSRFALLNSLAITAMLILVVWAFGWRSGLFFALFFSVNFADRYITAGGFIRYFWLAALISGVALLKKQRYGWAAGLMVFSALFQIFPVLFLAGMGGKIGFELYSRRRLLPGHRRFVLSGLLTAAVLLMLSISIGRGTDNWRDFLRQMELNSGRMATGRIGYLYNFLHPKEVEKEARREPYQDKVRRAKTRPVAGPVTLWDIKEVTTLLILVAVALLLTRTSETEYTLLLGFALFFMLFSTVRYYYAGLVGFPLVFHRHMKGWPGRVYTLAMLAVMGVAYLVQDHTIYSFVYNTLLTVAFTAMILGTTVFLYLRRPPEEV